MGSCFIKGIKYSDALNIKRELLRIKYMKKEYVNGKCHIYVHPLHYQNAVNTLSENVKKSIVIHQTIPYIRSYMQRYGSAKSTPVFVARSEFEQKVKQLPGLTVYSFNWDTISLIVEPNFNIDLLNQRGLNPAYFTIIK